MKPQPLLNVISLPKRISRKYETKRLKKNKNWHQTKATIPAFLSLKNIYPFHTHNNNTNLRSIDPGNSRVIFKRFIRPCSIIYPNNRYCIKEDSKNFTQLMCIVVHSGNIETIFINIVIEVLPTCYDYINAKALSCRRVSKCIYSKNCLMFFRLLIVNL